MMWHASRRLLTLAGGAGLMVLIAGRAEAGLNEWLQVTPLVADSLRVQAAQPYRAPVVAARPHVTRPAALLPLYVSFGVLQAGDAHSTIRAIQRGSVEANPLMIGAAGSQRTLSAVKVATTAATIAGAELLWRRNRVAAVVTMVVINGAYAAIVTHNYQSSR